MRSAYGRVKPTCHSHRIAIPLVKTESRIGIYIASIRSGAMIFTSVSLNHIVLLIPFIGWGCGLLYPEETEQPTCERIKDESLCEEANEEDGITEDACFIWQCKKDGNGCDPHQKRDEDYDGYADYETCKDELDEPLDCNDHNGSIHPDAGESCDGIDNDCNGYTDEGLLEEIDTYSIKLPGVDSTGSDCEKEYPIRLTVASTQPDPEPAIGVFRVVDTNVCKDISGVAWLGTTGDNVNSDFQQLSYKFKKGGRPIDGCPNGIKNNQCDFQQIGFDGLEDRWLVASVSHSGYTCGELRIGFVDKRDRILDLGDVSEAPYNSGLRYDTGNQQCISEGADGVRFPSVAVTDHGEYALVLWLNENNKHPREPNSASSPESVRLLARGLPVAGMQLKPPDTENDDVWTIGNTTNLEKVALLPWTSTSKRGFIAAYTNQDEAIEFARFDLRENDNQELVYRAPCSQSEPLGPVKTIAFAMGDHTGKDQLRILAAFRLGHGENTEVGVALYNFNPNKKTSDCLSFTLEDILPLRTAADGGNIKAGPVLAYGHVAQPKEGNSIGGWVVLWIERKKEEGEDILKGFHILEDEDSNLKLLEETPFELVKSGSLDSPLAFTRLEKSGSTKTVLFGVVDNSAALPIWGTTSCQTTN